eukprot:scaffold23809_cov74-Phaeocystis_antarctica.AAC.8
MHHARCYAQCYAEYYAECYAQCYAQRYAQCYAQCDAPPRACTSRMLPSYHPLPPGLAPAHAARAPRGNAARRQGRQGRRTAADGAGAQRELHAVRYTHAIITMAVIELHYFCPSGVGL